MIILAPKAPKEEQKDVEAMDEDITTSMMPMHCYFASFLDATSTTTKNNADSNVEKLFFSRYELVH